MPHSKSMPGEILMKRLFTKEWVELRKTARKYTRTSERGEPRPHLGPKRPEA